MTVLVDYGVSGAEMFNDPLYRFQNCLSQLYDLGFYPPLDAALSDATETRGPDISIFDEALAPFVPLAREAPSFLSEAATWIEDANGLIKIGDLCRELGTTLPTLNKCFRKVVVLTPKYFAWVIQFNHVGDLIMRGEPSSIAALAAEAGFTDQAHFTRVVKEFVFRSPAAFLYSDYASIATFVRQGFRTS